MLLDVVASMALGKGPGGAGHFVGPGTCVGEVVGSLPVGAIRFKQ